MNRYSLTNRYVKNTKKYSHTHTHTQQTYTAHPTHKYTSHTYTTHRTLNTGTHASKQHTGTYTKTHTYYELPIQFPSQEDICPNCYALELNLKPRSFRATFINTPTAPNIFIVEISTISMHLFIKFLFVFPRIYRTFGFLILYCFFSLRILTGIIANNYLQKNVR